MAGSMSLSDLVADLKRSLHDSAPLFNAQDDADFVRFLTLALPDMGYKRPRTQLGQLVLTAGTPRYSLAAFPDFSTFKTHLWDRQNQVYFPQPWEPAYPGLSPRVCASNDGQGYWLDFDPAPNFKHISALGSTFKFFYFAQHTLGEQAAATTVTLADRGLLLLRAQAEAMRELMLRNMSKPVQLRDGLSGTPRNSTPAAVYDALMRNFLEAR